VEGRVAQEEEPFKQDQKSQMQLLELLKMGSHVEMGICSRAWCSLSARILSGRR
jgi:hypothetical protein